MDDVLEDPFTPQDVGKLDVAFMPVTQSVSRFSQPFLKGQDESDLPRRMEQS